jgi:hypothetical protein
MEFYRRPLFNRMVRISTVRTIDGQWNMVALSLGSI